MHVEFTDARESPCMTNCEQLELFAANLVGTTTYVDRLRTTRVVRCNLVGTTTYVVRTSTSLVMYNTCNSITDDYMV